MQAKPRRINILLAEDPFSFQKRLRYWRCLMFERGVNLSYVTWIRRLNPVHNIRIVSGRLSSRCVVGDLGFCDLSSLDISPIAINTRCVRRSVRMVAISIGVDAVCPLLTKLSQRVVEVTLVLPLHVLISLHISNLHRVRDAWDRFKAAAAADRNNHDYAEYNKPEPSR